MRQDLHSFVATVGDFDSEEFISARQARLQALRDRLDSISMAVVSDTLGGLSSSVLLDLQSELQNEFAELDLYSRELSERATQRDHSLDKLDEHIAQWEELVDSARNRNAPSSVLSIAENTMDEILRLRVKLEQDRNAALDGLSDITDLQRTTTAFSEEMLTRQNTLLQQAEALVDVPLWRPEVWKSDIPLFVAAGNFRRAIWSLAQYLSAHAGRLVAVLLITFLLSSYFLRMAGSRVATVFQQDSVGLRAMSVFERPQSASLLIALIALVFAAPSPPTVFLMVVFSLIPIPAALLAVSVFARPVRVTVVVITVILTMNWLRLFTQEVQVIGRLVLILQLSLLAWALYFDLKRRNWHATFPAARTSVIRFSVLATCAVLGIAILAEIFGHSAEARKIKSVVVSGLGLGMVFGSLYYVLTGLILSVLSTRGVSKLNIVRSQRHTIYRSIKKSVMWLVLVTWLLITLATLGVLAPMLKVLNEVMIIDINLGALSINTGALLTGLLILLVTWGLNRIVKFVLAGSPVAGSAVTESVAFAISKLLRYTIAVAGFLFAIAVIGFDITKVTVLAGALGVGIGFGLQNIVNNFVSGIILLFEQPIKINDIAEVGGTMGTVRELGVRSTVIETFDGGEVIVPNADLVSKTVMNWTRSNRRRRAEIDVGVAYGTDPQMVLDLLHDIAGRHSAVLGDPEPFAVFIGFGDSSLNFRLYAWMSDLAEVLKTPSAIRQDILRELEEADVSIPFPQRDVRVTLSSGGDPAQRLSAEMKPA